MMFIPKKESINLSTAASTVSIPSSASVAAFGVLSGNKVRMSLQQELETSLKSTIYQP
jgi:hypothetical protein